MNCEETDVYKIAVADDHPVIRDGLALMLESDERLQIHLFVRDGADLFLEAKLSECDLVILDISMPGMNGILTARRLIKEYSDIPILVFTMHESMDFFQECIGLGVRGYVLKRDPPEVLLNAIKNIQEGKLGITPSISPMSFSEGLNSRNRDLYARLQDVFNLLTEREREVLGLMTNGLTSKQISKNMGVKLNTINKHRENIRAKLGHYNMSDLIFFVRSFNLLD